MSVEIEKVKSKMALTKFVVFMVESYLTKIAITIGILILFILYIVGVFCECTKSQNMCSRKYGFEEDKIWFQVIVENKNRHSKNSHLKYCL